jgi:uncharacterized protein YqjF (DUF2071 family)
MMNDIDKILDDTTHRPFSLPNGKWKYYQEWNRVLFLHWTIPFNILRKYVPENLSIDTYCGNCYISLVAFTMQNIRPRGLLSISGISDFDEINLRTYIEKDNKKGVYFLSIEAEKIVSTFLARYLSGLPNEKSAIKRTDNIYESSNAKKGFYNRVKQIMEYEVSN